MNMSEKIKQLRLKNKLTQEELGHLLGLQKSAIAKYESGKVENIKRSTIAKMSDIFEVNPVWLMDLSDDMSYPNKDVIEKIAKLSPANLAKLSELVDLYLSAQDNK